jgi:L-gulonolactone oxidase
MRGDWRNWAGDQRCRPAAIEAPGTREELAEIVLRAADRGLAVRASGSGHSFTEIALTDGVMVRFDRLDRVLSADAATGLVKVEAGIVLGELNRRLDGFGLAFENLGDIDRQTLAGSVATGTHGTGARFTSVSAQVEAVEIVLSDGSALEISAAGDPSALEAVRIGLGALGLIYAITVRTVPAYRIDRLDNPKPLDETLTRLDELNEANDHFEFYVFPHTEIALCRESRRTDEPPQPRSPAAVYAREVMLENWVGRLFVSAARRLPSQVPRLSRLAGGGVGRSRKLDKSYRVFASDRRIRFTEMEYGIPREHAPEAVRRVLEIASRPEHRVAFPIEVRFAAPDEVMLSASYRRPTCYVAVHQDHRIDWRPYFRAVEEVMRSYGGRPHWGKRHFQTAETLAELYPRWADFQALRDRLDPDRRFRNLYTDRVLG